MESISEFFETLLDSEKLIQYGGVTLLVIIIFLETGVFFGFFLPGDYLLFTAGLLAGTKDLDVPLFLLLCLVTASAIAGNFSGYAFGKWAGKKLYKRKDTFFFRKKYLEKTRSLFKRYGIGSLIIGRFLPIARTFLPILAGAIALDFRRFSFYNVVGAFLWTWTFIPLGFYLGRKYPQIIQYVEYFIIGFFAVTTLILISEYLKLRKKSPARKR